MNNLNKNILPPLDTTLTTYQERIAFIEQIFANIDTSKLTPSQLERCSDYIIEAMPREERKQRVITTRNRQSTINKRETSYETLVEKLEGGEDALHNYIINDKNRRITHEKSTLKIAETVDTQQLQTAIQQITEMQKTATTPHDRYLLRKTLIELYQDQYLLYTSLHPIGYPTTIPTFNPKESQIEWAENRWVDAKGQPHSDALINFFTPEHIAALLKYHEELVIAAIPNSELDFLLQDFDALVEKSLAAEPHLLDIVHLKYGKRGGADIQKHLIDNYNISFALETLSRIWCVKIPKKIADFAKQEYIQEVYTKKHKLKRCSKCLKEKPAHSYFFSPNPQAKDGFHPCCKECRKTRKD